MSLERHHGLLNKERDDLHQGTAAAPGRGRRARLAKPSADGEVILAGVAIAHPERVLYPEGNITKLDIARYYVGMAPVILPYVRNRPLSLLRCPQGPASPCFFQKHAMGHGEGLCQRHCGTPGAH